MGKQQEALTALLSEAGEPRSSHPRPNAEAIRRLGITDEVQATYVRLGGIRQEPRVVPGAWDIPCADVIIELDERQHFNRYRAITLESATYKDGRVVDVSQYETFCASFEGECLRKEGRAGYWTNASAEREFGCSGPPGVLEGAGAARWRQRAFYDFVKDAYATASGVPLVRVAIWETIGAEGAQLTLGRALMRRARCRDEDLAVRTLAHLLTRIKHSTGANPVAQGHPEGPASR